MFVSKLRPGFPQDWKTTCSFSSSRWRQRGGFVKSQSGSTDDQAMETLGSYSEGDVSFEKLPLAFGGGKTIIGPRSNFCLEFGQATQANARDRLRRIIRAARQHPAAGGQIFRPHVSVKLQHARGFPRGEGELRSQQGPTKQAVESPDDICAYRYRCLYIYIHGCVFLKGTPPPEYGVSFWFTFETSHKRFPQQTDSTIICIQYMCIMMVVKC